MKIRIEYPLSMMAMLVWLVIMLLLPSRGASFQSPGLTFVARPTSIKNIQPITMEHSIDNNDIHQKRRRRTTLLHQGSSDEKDKTNLTKAQKAASILAAQLQAMAFTKAMEKSQNGDIAQAEAIFEGLEKMMQAPPSSQPEPQAEPGPEPAKEEEEEQQQPASSKFSDVDIAKTQQILDDIEKRMGDSVDAEAQKEVAQTETEIKEPVQEEATTTAKEAEPIEEVTSEEEGSDSKDEAPPKEQKSDKEGAEPEGEPEPAVSTYTLPRCISTDFGQALPVLAENLPPLREPIVLKSEMEPGIATATTPTPVKPSSPSKPEAVDTNEKSTEPELKLSDDDYEALISQAAAAIPPPPPEEVEKKEEKDNSESESDTSSKVDVKTTMPESSSEESKEEPAEDPTTMAGKDDVESSIVPPLPKEDEDEKEKDVSGDVVAATEDETASVELPTEGMETKEVESKEATTSSVIIPPPPKEESESKEEKSERVIVPPPPTEEKGGKVAEPTDETEPAQQSTVELEIKTESVDDIQSKEEQTTADGNKPESSDELSERYASLPLKERAAAILFDLGIVEETPDPSSPGYDSSKDDEICPDTIWKEKKQS